MQDLLGQYRGVFSSEFKLEAAKDLDVHENVLRKWVRELREEVAKLKMGRDILKIGRGLLREGVDVRFGAVAKHRGP